MEGTDEYYRKAADDTAQILEGYYNDNEGWQLHKKTPKDVTIQYKHSTCQGFSGYLYRGKSEYNCPKETLFEYVDPLPLPAPRLRWDKAVKFVEVVRTIDETVRLNLTGTSKAAMGLISPRDFVDAVMTSMPYYGHALVAAVTLRLNLTGTSSAAMGLISPRDFVDAVMTIKEDKRISTNGISVNCPQCPPREKFVRGWNYHCGIMCLEHPERPQHSILMSFIQPDIRGMLPQSLVDSAIPGSMVEFFDNLRACLKADGKLVD